MTSTDVALSEATDGAVAQLRTDEFMQQIALAVPAGVLPRQIQRAAATAVLNDRNLGAPALRADLLKAIIRCAQDGLMPDGNEAALIIRNKKGGGKQITYQPMIGGYRKIAGNSRWSIFTSAVYANDAFEPDTDAHRTNHRPPRLGEPRGEIIGAYAIAEHADGRRVGPEVMDLAEIEKIRKTSASSQVGPWKDWYERMCEKTVGRRLFKKLPLDPNDAMRAQSVIQADDDPVAALYGNGPGDDKMLPAGASPGPQAGGEGEATPEPQPAPSPTPTAEVPQEPSDDELERMGAEIIDGEGHEITESEPFRLTTESAAFQGQTLQEVYEGGNRGIGWLRWAYFTLKVEPLRAALDAFATEHPEITEPRS